MNRLLSFETEKVQCACPGCGEIREEYLEVEFTKSKDAWKRGDYFVVLCFKCRRSYKRG